MRPELRWSLLAGAAYVAVCLAVGEHFPASRFSMYAGLAGKDQAAVPVFELAGAPVDPRTLGAFTGFEGPLVPPGVASGLLHELAPVRQHIAAHRGPGAGPGEPLVLVWRVARIVDGRVVEERRVGATGRAWP